MVPTLQHMPTHTLRSPLVSTIVRSTPWDQLAFELLHMSKIMQCLSFWVFNHLSLDLTLFYGCGRYLRYIRSFSYLFHTLHLCINHLAKCTGAFHICIRNPTLFERFTASDYICSKNYLISHKFISQTSHSTPLWLWGRSHVQPVLT